MLGGIEDGNNTTSVEGWGEGGPLVLFFVFLSTNFVKLVLYNVKLAMSLVFFSVQKWHKKDRNQSIETTS